MHISFSHTILLCLVLCTFFYVWCVCTYILSLSLYSESPILCLRLKPFAIHLRVNVDNISMLPDILLLAYVVGVNQCKWTSMETFISGNAQLTPSNKIKQPPTSSIQDTR